MGRDKVPRPSAKKGKKEAAKAATKGKAAGGEGDADMMLDPLCIRFTHAKIRSTFSGCGRKIEQTMQEIRDGKITPLDLPRITVIPLEDGKTYCSLNNRRLYVFRWARGDGLLPGNKVGVRIKPMETTTRHAAKYSLERCSDKARFIREPGDKASNDASRCTSTAAASDTDTHNTPQTHMSTATSAPDAVADVTTPPQTITTHTTLTTMMEATTISPTTMTTPLPTPATTTTTMAMTITTTSKTETIEDDANKTSTTRTDKPTTTPPITTDTLDLGLSNAIPPHTSETISDD
eukprot:m.27703 g.27703  ORF g.27703 m.27703 type:complete len:292 (-) comp15793_c0_seq1:279-1154(-)